MNQENTMPGSLSPSFVKSQLDEILAAEIASLIEIDSELARLNYTLATVSCILIAVEREREIKMFADSPPERFTRQTIMDELVDIGLDHDESLEQSLESVLEQGYVSVRGNGSLKAEVSAYTMLGFLDTIFPGMQGMNLIAFVLQMNDEVISGRKSLEDAKKSFAQTLKSRGAAVSRQKVQEKASELASTTPTSIRSNAARKLKEDNKKRLSSYRLKKTGMRPSVYSSDTYSPEKVQIKTLFDQEPDSGAEALEAEERLREAQKKAEELEALEAKVREAEEKARELEVREMALKAAQKLLEETEAKEQEIRAREAEMAIREAELKAKEEELRAASETSAREKAEPAPSALETSEDIESRIAAFEAELATPCPVCGRGHIVKEQTPKGKEYYSCNNKDCRFVSWDRPHLFSCPSCKNPYLIEIPLSSGAKGLKCPRAACSFTQDSLDDPGLAAMEDPGPVRRKKKVVRRVKRRS